MNQRNIFLSSTDNLYMVPNFMSKIVSTKHRQHRPKPTSTSIKHNIKTLENNYENNTGGRKNEEVWTWNSRGNVFRAYKWAASKFSSKREIELYVLSQFECGTYTNNWKFRTSFWYGNHEVHLHLAVSWCLKMRFISFGGNFCADRWLILEKLIIFLWNFSCM